MFFGGGGGFPGGFPGMEGGMPGGGGRRSRAAVDTSKFYKLLEVEKNVGPTEIKKAYRKLAVKHHPDKGGDAEKFKELTRAYEVLSDPKKKEAYDQGGEEAVDGDGGGMDAGDIFSQLFGGGGGARRGSQQRPKTKDVVQPIKLTLEQMYNGHTKKMAITRSVIDKKKGVQHCSQCDGRGVQVQVIRMGPMIQQMQTACGACGGQGKSFSTKKEREILELHVQKGATDGHKIAFTEKADEEPEHTTGDVIFVCKQEEHKEFKRRGADLFVERTISLSEALCGFSLELTHLDGRKLLIKSSEGEVIRPMAQGFDPMADTDGKMEWDTMKGFDWPDGDNVAQADLTDPDTLKKACETQLKRKGIDVACFVVDGQRAYFKSGTREEAIAGKKKRSNCDMYVLKDPNAKDSTRLMKAVKDEGMPTVKNPFVHGNLFLILTVQFPDCLTPEIQGKLKELLPPPLLPTPTFKSDDPSVEPHTLVDIDPVSSFNANKINMASDKGAYDEDDDEGGQRGPGGQQCQQM